jgi:hypothetical protein
MYFQPEQEVFLIIMKYPSLVPAAVCKIPVTLTIYADELTEDGAPAIAATFTGFCNYQDTAQRVYTSDRHYIQLTGKALFNGDIFPALSAIADGQAEIFGEPRRIFRGTKARNPDGSVNYTEIQLM